MSHMRATDLSKVLKSQFHGLKRLIECYSHILRLGDDHSFNPHVHLVRHPPAQQPLANDQRTDGLGLPVRRETSPSPSSPVGIIGQSRSKSPNSQLDRMLDRDQEIRSQSVGGTGPPIRGPAPQQLFAPMVAPISSRLGSLQATLARRLPEPLRPLGPYPSSRDTSPLPLGQPAYDSHQQQPSLVRHNSASGAVNMMNRPQHPNQIQRGGSEFGFNASAGGGGGISRSGSGMSGLWSGGNAAEEYGAFPAQQMMHHNRGGSGDRVGFGFEVPHSSTFSSSPTYSPSYSPLYSPSMSPSDNRNRSPNINPSAREVERPPGSFHAMGGRQNVNYMKEEQAFHNAQLTNAIRTNLAQSKSSVSAEIRQQLQQQHQQFQQQQQHYGNNAFSESNYGFEIQRPDHVGAPPGMAGDSLGDWQIQSQVGRGSNRIQSMGRLPQQQPYPQSKMNHYDNYGPSTYS